MNVRYAGYNDNTHHVMRSMVRNIAALLSNELIFDIIMHGRLAQSARTKNSTWKRSQGKTVSS